MIAHPSFSFQGQLWEFSSEKTTWVFTTLPQDMSDEISELVPRTPGFGSVRVEVSIGASNWGTSLFPSKEHRSYILPVKRAVREAESLAVEDTVEVVLGLRID